MSNTFKTELIWNVYDGTNEPTEGKTYLVLTSELPLIKCEYCCGKWERYRKLVSCLKLGDMFALFPDVNQFPKFNVIISLEGDLPMAKTDCAPNHIKPGDIIRFTTAEEIEGRPNRIQLATFNCFFNSYIVASYIYTINLNFIYKKSTKFDGYFYPGFWKIGYFSNVIALYPANDEEKEVYKYILPRIR